MGLAITPPRSLARERAQRRPQHGVVLDDRNTMTLGRAVLARQPACPTPREPQPLLQSQDGTTPPGWAQKFPADNSLRP